MLHGKSGVVLPTAAPRVKARVPQLSFTSFNPQHCKPLQIWPVSDIKSNIIVLPPMITRPDPNTSASDPVINAAYQWAIQQHTAPMAVEVCAMQSHSGIHYLDFDEAVLEQMARQGWNRSHGIAKLVPLACALHEHWQRAEAAKAATTRQSC